MPRTDRSVTILTGMIVAALILLFGFSRESTMRREAEALADTLRGAGTTDAAANRKRWIERPVCLPLSPWPAKGSVCGAGKLADKTPASR